MRGVAVAKEEGVEPGVTFGSPHQPMVAQLAGTSIEPNEKMMRPPSKDPSCLRYVPGMEGEAYIVRFSPNLNDPTRMKKVLDSHYDAVILEGYAAGNIPTKIADVIREACERMMIIITPSTATHGAHESLYEVSAEIAHPSAQHFVGPSHVALTKFQWLFKRARALGLRNTKEKKGMLEWIREKFAIDFVGEDLRSAWTDDISPLEYLHTDIPVSRFREKFATSSLFNLPHCANPDDERQRNEMVHASKLSDIHLQIKKQWLEKHADLLIGDGSLPESDRAAWIKGREALDYPVTWITETAPAPRGDLLYMYLKSSFVDPYQHVPYMDISKGQYVFSPLVYQYFGLNASRDGEQP